MDLARGSEGTAICSEISDRCFTSALAVSECVPKARFWHTNKLTDCHLFLIVVSSQGL